MKKSALEELDEEITTNRPGRLLGAETPILVFCGRNEI